MNLFLDTSVLLAASGSAKGAARALFRLAPQQGWRLMASPYPRAGTFSLVRICIATSVGS